jgi:hypothetical protein
VLAMLGIRRHYERVARRLRAGAAAVLAAPPARNTTLLLVESIDAATEQALWLTRMIAGDDFRVIHVPGRRTDPGIRPRWFRYAETGPQLEVLDTDIGRVEAVVEQVWRLPRGESDFVTVVIPELFESDSILEQARRPLELALKLKLLAESGVVVADVPVVAGTEAARPKRAVVRVLVSDVNAASMRAVNYARTLGVPDTAAIHFAFGPEDAIAVRRAWLEEGPPIPLEVDDAPYRDIGVPLRRYVRDLTADGETGLVVVMPELVVRGWRRVLHNQRPLYVKRLLLFEPRVVLASVPYQLLR